MSELVEHNNLDFGSYKTNVEEDTEKFSNKVWCGSGPVCNDHVWDMEWVYFIYINENSKWLSDMDVE